MNNLEIYNNACVRMGYPDINGDVYDEMLRGGKRLFCVAADDNHSPVDRLHADMFGSFTMFRTSGLSHAEIMTAFERGDFYASTGPEIDQLYIEDGKLCVTTRGPVQKIRMLTCNRHTGVAYNDDGTPINGAEFWLHGDDVYVRLEIFGTDGTMAWTNACFLDEIGPMEYSY